MNDFSHLGNPRPTVKWYINNVPQSSKSVRMSGNVLRNSLVIDQLERRHLHSVLECKASNYNQTPPLVAAVSLDMNCKFLCYDRFSFHLEIYVFILCTLYLQMHFNYPQRSSSECYYSQHGNANRRWKKLRNNL